MNAPAHSALCIYNTRSKNSICRKVQAMAVNAKK